ncbi:LamG-like jellyroll fold domain-containing protein [Streptacidiphilus sp. PAMC 29251]
MSTSRFAATRPGRSTSRLLAVAVTAAVAATSLATGGIAHAAEPAKAPQRSGASKPKSAAHGLDPLESASAVARKTGKPVTVDQLTDSGTLVVANPDGTYTQTSSSVPQRVKQGKSWVSIDTSLVRHSDGTWGPKAAVTGLSFSGGGSNTLVSMATGTDSLGFSWPTALPKPVISGDTATYPDVLPDVDLQLTADASGYSSVLVLKSAAAANDPGLANLALGTTSGNVTLSQTSDGGAQAVDRRTGETVFHSDTALMWDSSGAPVDASSSAPATTPSAAHAEHLRSDQVGAHRAQVQVKLSRGKQQLGLDKALLTAPGVTYPVFVDPEWSGPKTQLKWARISDNGWNVYNSTSTTGATNAREGWDNNSPGNGERARTYYQMDTSGIKGAEVSEAYLEVKQLSAASCADTPAAAYGTDTPAGWSSSTLYWGHEPTVRTGALGPSNPQSHEAGVCPVTNGTGSYVSPPELKFDVTSRAQTTAAAKSGTMTLMVQSPNMNDATQWKQFAYGGGATLSVTYSFRPKLKDGTGDPAVKPSITNTGKIFTTTHTPTLSARAIDPDLTPHASELVRIGYQVYNSAGTEVATGFGPNLNAKGKPQYNTNGSDWTTPHLADGTYTWKATAQNAAGYWVGPGAGIWTKTQTFTIDTTAPPAPTVSSTQFPPKQIGGAFSDLGTFVLNNNHTNNITGYLVSLDATLGSTVYTTSTPHWVAGAAIVPGKVYYATADNGPGTGTSVINGSAAPVFAPGTTGPHTLFAKSVDQAGSTSIQQTPYLFSAGTSTPVFTYGDKLISGYTATNTDSTTTVVPKATTTSTGGQLVSQGNTSGTHYADGFQAMLGNKSSTVKVAAGDRAVFSFDIPKDAAWDLGADLTTAKDYGLYSLTLDKGQPTESVLIGGFDAYSSFTTTKYLDFGIPKSSKDGSLLTLKKGVHTLTLALLSKNPSSAGFQAGIDVLRIAPTLSCSIIATSGCLNNTATSTFTASPAATSTADADGSGTSINAPDLTSTLGWQSGKTVTVDGATITLPSFGTGNADNMLGSGQIVTVPTTTQNNGSALVFLAFATGGGAKTATGTVTYAPGNCLPGGTKAVDQGYTLDTVPDWVAGPADSAVATLVHENHSNNTQTSPSPAPKIYAVSVPLSCPGAKITSVSLPLFSNGVKAGQSSIHILGLGIRPTSITNAGATHWVGSWADAQDTAKVQNQAGATVALTGQTLRIPAHLSIGTSNDSGTDTGNAVRIHLSNATGTSPVTFDAASLALQDSTAGGATAAAAPIALTFGGHASVAIPAGGDATSDPVPISADTQDTVLVSLHLSANASALPGHASAQTPVWISDAANRTADTAATNYTATTYTGLPYLSGIDVTTPVSAPTGSLVLFGDQTVNADSGQGDGQHHLSDAITGALVNDPNGPGDGSVPYGVLNEGTNSWSLNNNHLPQITNAPQPLNALGPVDRSVLAQGNVRTVLLSTGTSDLLNCTGTANTCATNVESGLIALVSQIRAYNTDDGLSTGPDGAYLSQNSYITTYVATIPPFTHTATAAQESARQLVNSYLTSGSNFSDGIVDFAAAVSSDGTDTSATVKAADLNAGNPDNAYYSDLAAGYLSAVQSTVVVAPDVAVALAPDDDTPENEWQLSADGSDSDGSNPLTPVGGVTFGSDAPDSLNAGTGSASFDGSTGFLESDHAAVDSTADYSISAWVKINSDTTATAFCQGTSAYQAFSIGYDSTNKGWMFQTTTSDDDTAQWPTAEGGPNTAAIGTWTHLVVTYTAPVDGDTSTGLMSIYQNGTLMGTATNATPQYDSSLPLTIGGCVNSGTATTPDSGAFPGSVADVHVYPTALESAQADTASLIVPQGWANGMPEDEWKLASDGTDTGALNGFTPVGGATYSTDHPNALNGGSGSVAFDGSTGFLRSRQSAVDTAGDYSVSAWVKINSATGSTAVCQGTSEHQAFYIGYDSGNKGWMFQTTTANAGTADSPTAEGGPNTAVVGAWTHLVVTYTAPVDGNASTGLMSIYQNGTLMGTATNITPQYDSSMPLTIGGCVNSDSGAAPYSTFPGSVADVHVYPTALAPALADTASLIVPQGWTNGMPEDEWKLATDGTDTGALNPFTVTGGATYGTDHPTSTSAGTGSVAFDGTTGMLQSKQNAINTAGDYSVSAWVKIGSNTSSTAVCQSTSEHQAFYIGYDSVNKGWEFQTTTSNDDNAQWPTAEGGPNTAVLGTWTHLVVTFKASTGVMSIYQNGTLTGTATNPTPQYDSSAPLTVGGCVNSSNPAPYATFPGSVADLHTYPQTLSASQVSALS